MFLLAKIRSTFFALLPTVALAARTEMGE